ncbi:Abi family protein [Flectobacillus roseus]|uniref:Abi family protein n=1 Tax=Flectobacillus roseus TaxID=502259 RepID=UPI0024B85CAA|nr:Abi family protein [Flectobacillus roseus]MDI9867894.1 Abi family protein [Flectobacillus roseus]
MKYVSFTTYFSSPRTGRYLIACANDTKRCIKLYKANLKVAQAFHPLLGCLEVVLRNGVNDQLTTHFADPNWIINQKNGFMVDPLLTHTNKKTGKITTNRFILNSVKSAEDKLRKRGIAITSGRIISEQTFGFWTDLFENHHYKILKGRPIKLFKHLPSGYGRTQVLNELTKVRQFRNRINHNEPICFVGVSIDFSITIGVYNSILNLLKWIDPELINWIKDIDKINATVTKGLKI